MRRVSGFRGSSGRARTLQARHVFFSSGLGVPAVVLGLSRRDMFFS